MENKNESPSAIAKFKALWATANKRVLFMVGLIVAIWIVFDFLSGGYILKAENLANLFRQVTVVALLSIAMTLVIVSGCIDLSVGSALGMFGAFAAAMMSQIHINSAATVIIILIAGFIVGCAHGALIHYLNIPSFVVTLGGLIAYRGVTQWVARESIPIWSEWVKAIASKCIPDWLGIGFAVILVVGLIVSVIRKRRSHIKIGLPNKPLLFDVIKIVLVSVAVVLFTVVLTLHEGVPIQVMILLAAATVMSLASRYTKFGHYVYAIGGNKQAALYSGIPIAQTIVLVFGLMGLFAAAAGIITISELNSAAPDVGDLKELEAIAACVIGGTSLMGGSGQIGMSVLGALVMASIKNGMSMMGIAAQMQKVILGSLLVIAVGLDQWSRKIKKQ